MVAAGIRNLLPVNRDRIGNLIPHVKRKGRASGPPLLWPCEAKRFNYERRSKTPWGEATMLKAILAAILCTIATAHAQSIPRNAAGELENSHAFAIAYAMSFQSFDSCGDPHHGALIRKALTKWFELCPFSAAAKTHFHSWQQAALPKMTEAAKTLRSPPPICNAITRNPQYSQTIAALDDFKTNPAMLPHAVLIKCDQVPVYP